MNSEDPGNIYNDAWKIFDAFKDFNHRHHPNNGEYTDVARRVAELYHIHMRDQLKTDGVLDDEESKLSEVDGSASKDPAHGGDEGNGETELVEI